MEPIWVLYGFSSVFFLCRDFKDPDRHPRPVQVSDPALPLSPDSDGPSTGHGEVDAEVALPTTEISKRAVFV